MLLLFHVSWSDIIEKNIMSIAKKKRNTPSVCIIYVPIEIMINIMGNFLVFMTLLKVHMENGLISLRNHSHKFHKTTHSQTDAHYYHKV